MYQRHECDIRSKKQIPAKTEEEKRLDYENRVVAWMRRGLCRESAEIMAKPGMPPYPWEGVCGDGYANTYEPNIHD